MQQDRANSPELSIHAYRSASIDPMPYIQPIIHKGRLVAIVVGGQAIISDTVPSRELATVKAMCLYALEIADGDRPGPYTDAHALAYARAAAATLN